MHVACRSGRRAALCANQSRVSLRALFVVPRPPIAFVPMARNPLASRNAYRNPWPLLPTRPHTAMRSAPIRTQNTTHFPMPLRSAVIVCAMSSDSYALFPSGAASASTLPDERSTQPTLLLPWTPAPYLRTGARSDVSRAPENVQSRFGRHPTYQRHASSMNRILPEAFRR
jgi:hypothetical protein